MPPISFNQVPSGIRVPFVYVEFDDSRALQGPTLMPHELLVIAQRTSSGTVAELTPFVATNADQVREKAGAGSQAHLMAEALFENNRLTKTTFVLQDDAGGATAAQHTIVCSGTSTEAGTLHLYIAGYRIQVAITSGMASTAVASAINTAITAVVDELPVTTAVASSTVTLTAKNAGTLGNDIDVRDSYYEGEAIPAGVGLAYANSVSGSGDPDVSEVWAVLGDTHYTVMAVPYTDASNIAELTTELADRAGPLRQVGSVAVLAKEAAHASLLTLGSGLNGPRMTVMGFNDSPTPSWKWAAACAGVIVESARNDPARPLQRLTINGVLAPPASSQFTLAERDLLLNDGIATHTVDAAGVVRIERMISTFQTNEAGAPSTAYLDIETALTLEYLRFDFKTQLLLKYPRHKLAGDGTKFGAGQAILTPKLARAEAINIARGWEELGLVEGIDQFAEDILVERNVQDPNRLDFLLPPDLVNGARVFGVQIGFLL